MGQPQGPGWWQDTNGGWWPPSAHPDPNYRQHFEGPGPSGPTQQYPSGPTQQYPSGPQQQYPSGPQQQYPSGPTQQPPWAQSPPPGAYWQSGGQGGQPPQWPQKKKPIVLIIGAVVVVVVLVAAGISAFAFGWFKDPKPAPTLLATTDLGEKPFDKDFSESPDFEADQLSQLQDVGDGIDGSEATGTERGLYGGSLDALTCDAGGIIEFLDDPDNSDKREAFADAEGVSSDELDTFIKGLTSVVLLRDTWVTNHGYEDGEATPFQAVLQAGTAVLIDEFGVPRVRCACGNPLLAPNTAEADPGQASTQDWEYDSGSVIQVKGDGGELSKLSMVDIDDGELVDRPLGIGRAGLIQIQLSWDTDADLDVHAVDPSNAEVYYQNKTVASGGELDVDIIPQVGDASPHIENIFWNRAAPAGRYEAFVFNFDARSSGSSPYTMKVFVGGVEVETQEGSLANRQTGDTVTFTLDG